MDDQCSDMMKSVEITAEHAVLIPSLSSVKNVMAYVEAVAVVIGSCHIHSVYEDGDNIKIYLNDKRFVDILVNNGVSILGRQMNVDYAVPRADKVILSNVDPIVPDAVLMKLLSYYGMPVSAIIHEKIATNSEYSHIECGKRKVYMKIFADKKIPNKINFTFQDVCYRIDVIVDQYDRNAVQESTPAEQNEEEMNDDLLEVGSNQSLKPNLNDLMNLNTKQPTPNQAAYRNRGKSLSDDSASTAVRKIKRRARGGWFASRLTRVKRMKSNPVNPNPSVRGKRLVVEKMVTAKKVGRPGIKRRKVGRPSISTQEINPDPYDVVSISGDENNTLDQGSTAGDPIDIQSITQYPLPVEELQKFVFKTRFHREPMQVATEFLADNKEPGAIPALISQLQEYLNVCKEQALKLRIRRLVSVLSTANGNAE
ncbi:hypothetical protein JTE90_005090 [Oedothorax gibbosus]|uniref:Uncharacterized protein n=1 Tax=Oedothorax gibbosus TaxID=931172 RepID=A0AAV6VCR0_9ARAC|nr:hypothetical protein JTE90_005090 [Oedothorax gibbosus]